ncbi:MAG: ATP-binding protein [Chloroflexi bacterium]|nr:MAG: ATP-binding protein [Chloroflexota bacterium]
MTPLSNNPFIFGDPVRGENFLNRKREIRRLAGRVAQGGSALVTGEPRTGKTSLLLRLQDAAAEIFGAARARQMTFRYLDGHTLTGWDAARFWREALRAFPEPPAPDLDSLERFFRALEKEGRQFVLLLDEFDALQNEPDLHRRDVYGYLRSLATRYSSFSLVLAARGTITDLNSLTRDFSRGSPFFNFLQEITLQPFPWKDVEHLLTRGAARFTREDRQFILRLGGRHPYFLQVAAYYLWDWYEDEAHPRKRYVKAGHDVYRAASEAVLRDIWMAWPPYMRVAFTLAALDAMPLLLGRERTFNLPALQRDLPNLSPELEKLAARGFLRQSPALTVGYEPQAEVMLWYLADELTRLTRPEVDLKTWLIRQQWDGLLTKGEKETLGKLFKQAGDLLQVGAKAFIEAAANGAGRALTG